MPSDAPLPGQGAMLLLCERASDEKPALVQLCTSKASHNHTC